MVKKEDLHEDFKKIVNNTIRNLDLNCDSVISVIGSGKRVTGMVIDKSTLDKVEISQERGTYRFVENMVETFVDMPSEEDLLFVLVAHALSGFLKSVRQGYNGDYNSLFKNDFYSMDKIRDVIDYTEKISRNSFYFHNRVKHFSILEFDWCKDYPYLDDIYSIENLFAMKLAYFLYRYKLVIELID